MTSIVDLLMTGAIVIGAIAIGAIVVYWLWPVLKSDAHGLSLFCPIKNGSEGGESYASIVRSQLQQLPVNEESPFASVPNTYLCRGYLLNDVFYEGGTDEVDEHLASPYLVFSSNYHGDLDPYLQGMWDHAHGAIQQIWKHCVGFEEVKDAASFKRYIQKCQVKTTFFFNGSSDDPLDDQLKALHLKQELSTFVFENQGMEGGALQNAFEDLLERTQPTKAYPRWAPGSAFGRTVADPAARAAG